jgi:ketosteroid isomerase-like protein
MCENKVLVSAFFSSITAGDVSAALDMVHDEATWWISGKPGEMPVCGTRSKAEISRLINGLIKQSKHGLRMTVKGMVAEESRVAVELESYAELKNGRTYAQQYHNLMIIEDGKIVAVREYFDTHHAFCVWS